MKKLSMLFATLAAVCVLHAECDYYAQLSAWAPGQIPCAPTAEISGLRLSLFYGDCQTLNGLDLGLSGRARQRMNGLQINPIFSVDSTLAGLGLGVVNFVENEMYGVQVGLWNHANWGAGLQAGLVNTAASFAGLQVGAFNWADDLDGLQLGLINVIADQTVFVFPVLNIGF